MAGAENMPQKFLDNILQELRSLGFIDAKRGIFGGYFLAKAAEDIRIGDVIRAFDGSFALTPCASLQDQRKCDDCSDGADCRLQSLMSDVYVAMSSVLDQRCLQDLIATSAF